MQLIGLTPEQVELAAFRFAAHENSATRIARHYRERDDRAKLELCRALRRVERRFAINLGTLCFKFLEKEHQPKPEVQRKVMDYVAYWNEDGQGERHLVVSVDRVREIDRLAEGNQEWVDSRAS
jgi:hypothetical protein